MEPTSIEVLGKYKRDTKDSTANNVIVGKQMINNYYIYLLGQCNNYIAEHTKYSILKDGQRSYLLPKNYIKMKTVSVKQGDQWFPVMEEVSVKKWKDKTVTLREGPRPYEYIILNERGQIHVELDPVPDADGNPLTPNLELIFEGYQDRLVFPEHYTTGTVAINQGSSSFTITGATLTSAMVGRSIRPTDGKYWYEIKEVLSAESGTLTQVFQEASVSGAGYIIAEVLRLPPEYGFSPSYAATRDHWRTKNASLAKEFDQAYGRDLIIMQGQYKAKSTGAVIPGRPVSYTAGSVPRNYPVNGIQFTE